MAVVTFNKLKVETEDDLQVLNGLLTSVTDGDILSINQYFANVESFQANANSAVAIGVTGPTSGVLTFKVAGGGSPNVWIRITGN